MDGASPPTTRGQLYHRRYRENTHLTDYQIFKIVSAALAALAMGYPLNRFITLQLHVAGLALFEAQVARARYLKLVGDWLRKVAKTGAFYIYVFENNPDGGLHVHILLHVPEAKLKQFIGRRQPWLKACGIPCKDHVFHSDRVMGSDGTTPECYLQNLRRLVRYMSKGGDPASLSDLGIKSENQGAIFCKRAGCSQALSLAIRRMIPSSERKAFVRSFLSGSIPVGVPNWRTET